MTERPTLVITDLDGSFWGRDLRCHPSTLAAVEELKFREIPLLIATGRRENSTRHGLAANGVDAPAVLLNGTLGIDLPTDTKFHVHPFPPEVAADVVERLAEIGLSPVVYTDDGRVRCDRNVTTGPGHRRQFGPDHVIEDPFATVRARSVLSFSMLGMGQRELEPAIEALGETDADALLYEDHLFQAWSVHIQPQAISKWDGIGSYLGYSGMESPRIVAVGDGNNDIEMLTNADVALGVDRGHEDALAVADHVLAHPDDGGWAGLLDHL